HVRTQTDALGNVTRMQYDALGRLTQTTEPARVTAAMTATVQNLTMVTHDAANNIVNVAVHITIGAQPVGDPSVNQVTATPVTSTTYDAYGNLVRQDRNPGDGGPTLTSLRSYDYGGNLASTTDANTYAR